MFNSLFGKKTETPLTYKAGKVRLFSKSYCPWCHKAMHWLEKHGIQYELLDVIENRAAFDEMERLTGQTMAPVIEVDGKILADFGPDELERFWRKLGQEAVAK